MIIGYMRVSTEQQSLDNQRHKILEYAQKHKMIIDECIEIEISSKKNQKSRLIDKLFEKLSSGDTFICTELSRLGRNMLEILNLIERFNQANIKLILILAIYGYFAQTERDYF